MKEDSLRALSTLIAEQNRVAGKIAKLIGRPAEKSHVGEYIASQVFDIALEESASCKAIDGHFRSGPLAHRSVNVKWYAKQENILDISQGPQPDYYLVLAGPRSAAISSWGTHRAWLIESVHLFNAEALLDGLKKRKLKIGEATSVRTALWNESELYPAHNSKELQISQAQIIALQNFGFKNSDAGEGEE